MWSEFMKSIGHRRGRRKEPLTAEMCAEIDRLGLDRGWFQRVVDDEGREFGQFCLEQRTKEAALFERWFPRLKEFAAEKRRECPCPSRERLGRVDAATWRILESKILDDERVPARGNFQAAFFTAPLHVLPLVISAWPSEYRHPIFLTPDELAEWHQIYAAEETDQDSWWFVYQNWNAEPNPRSDSSWLERMTLPNEEGHTLVLVTWGLCWGSLAGGERAELWSIDPAGRERFAQQVGDATY